MIVRRASAHRRNPALSYRRNSFTGDTRQISAGAVWNVGGPSAVSDTVIGVSNGRGGMLGSGTNAPLYTSSFLNRADPEAELEAYERRLALALDVDQADRILQHSPVPPAQNANHGGALLHVKHTWRDGAWVKDGVISRLFLSAQVVTTLANNMLKHAIDLNKVSGDLCRFYHSDMFLRLASQVMLTLDHSS
jgi:hypothetical protein